MWQFTNANAIDIPASADMKSDTYTVPGVYVCRLATTAETLVNCPAKTAFTLFVYKSVGSSDRYIIQEFRTIEGGSIYKRGRSYSGSWMETYEYGYGSMRLLPAFYNEDNVLEEAKLSTDIGIRFIQCKNGDTSIPNGYGYAMGIGLFGGDRRTIVLFPYSSSGVAINSQYKTGEWTEWKTL